MTIDKERIARTSKMKSVHRRITVKTGVFIWDVWDDVSHLSSWEVISGDSSMSTILVFPIFVSKNIIFGNMKVSTV